MSAAVDDFEVPDEEKTPVTVITGFLGAGKTTLLNYILKEQKEWRIAVIENEFGEVNIDEGLVTENLATKEDIVSMDNGCVCCTVRGDLVRTLNSLIARRKDFQAIMLETTGLADPAPIIQTFNSDATLQDNFRIDCVVTLVDAKNVTQHLREIKPDDAVNEAVQQVAFSDRIILNKLDLVSPEELAEVKEEIESINNTATIIESKRSIVDLGMILDQKAFSLDKTLEIDPDLLAESEEEEEEAAEPHAHVDGNADGASADDGAATEPPKKKKKKKRKQHDLSQVASVGMRFNTDFDVAKFNMFMSTLLQAKSADIYRSKGVLAFAGQGDTRFVFQGVHENINFGPSSVPFKEGEKRQSTLVFIGRGLNREELQAGLNECLVKES